MDVARTGHHDDVRLARHVLRLGLGLLYGCGLPESGEDAPPASPCRLEVRPTSISLTTEDGLADTAEVEVANRGLGACEVEAVVEGDPAWALVGDAGRTIEPSRADVVQLRLSPVVGRIHSATLLLTGASGDLPRVELVGWSTASPLPPPPPPSPPPPPPSSLLVVPNPIDFGDVGVGCESRARVIHAYNRSGSTRIIDAVTLATSSTGAFPFTTAPLPYALAPGHSVELAQVGLRPQAPGDFVATLTIEVPEDPGIAVSLAGRGGHDLVFRDGFRQARARPLDILVIVDGASVADRSAEVLEAMASLIDQLSFDSVDYQVGVARARGGADGPSGRLVRLEPSDSAFVVPGFDAHSDLEGRLRAVLETPAGGPSQGLEAAYRVLIPPQITDENAGFLRAGAWHAYVFVSAAPDASPNEPSFYAHFLGWILPMRDPPPVATIIGPRGGCTDGAGAVPETPRYAEMATLIGGTVVAVCGPDIWGPLASELSGSPEGAFRRTRFYLTYPPDESTFLVEVDEVEVPRQLGDASLWSYDRQRNSVDFAPIQAPLYGADIRISYDVDCPR